MKKKKLEKKKNNRVYFDFTRQSDNPGVTSGTSIIAVKKNNGSGLAGMTFNNFILFLFLLFLPTQLGKHFFFDFSYLSGVRVDYLAPTLYLTDILALSLVLLNFKSVSTFFKNKKVLLLLLFLSLNFFVSQSLAVSLYRYLKIVELLAIFAVFRQRKFPSVQLLFAFLTAGLFELILAVLQFGYKHSLQGIFYYFGERPLGLSLPAVAKASIRGVEFLRSYGTFSHPNSLAGFYLLTYFFILTQKKLFSTVFNRFKLISTILLFICTVLIFLSFSKIAITSFIVLNIVYLWNSKLKKYCRLCFFARIILLLTVPAIFLQATTDPLTIQKRIELLVNAQKIIFQHPLIGVGLGNYLIAQQQFPQYHPDFLFQPVHNIFILFICEVGLAVALILLLAYFKKLKKIFLRAPYIMLLIIFTGFFDHYWLTLQQNFLLLGVVFGLL